MLDDSVMRRSDALRELRELSRIILEDGVVTDAEADTLRSWIDENPVVHGLQAVDEIVEILRNVFADGRISGPERSQLEDILDELFGR